MQKCKVSEINVFLCFTQKFKMATQNGRKMIFWEKLPDNSASTMRVRNFIKIILPRTVSEINEFFAFYTENQYDHQKWQENNFWEKLPDDSVDTRGVKNFTETALSRIVSEIKAFPHRNSRWPPKMTGK